MIQTDLIPHLFRTEYSKITAVLCKSFGIEHIAIAEDIASEAFELALESWPYKGIPTNPTAWLYLVAKNKTKNYLKRNQLFTDKIAKQIKLSNTNDETIEIDLSHKNISDSQLQMLFAVCHPINAPEAQIGLALRILCGFGIDEIATAFLSNKETINKRLFRAKEKLRDNKIPIEFPAEKEINNRLQTVLATLYLLFNEGYYSESQDVVLREDLCMEAMRLTYLLIENGQTNQPIVNALLALMCFHASRFAARKNENGEMVLYQDQDELLWDYEMIKKGIHFLHQSAKGDIISSYHIEAQIAYWHTIKTDTIEKWENILQLYTHLLQINYSPIAALNRAYALSKTNRKQEAIEAAEKLQLNNNHYYFTLLGELYKDDNKIKAIANFDQAYKLAKTQTDKLIIKKKLDEL